MALPKVFIDGSHGTTGLKIQDRLRQRQDLELTTVSEADRRDVAKRREAIAQADLSILCLPDDAAIESAGWAAEAGTKVIDASTAHRVAADWVFGLAEMDPGQRDAIAASDRVSNPGCYATGVILAIRPLVEDGLLSDAFPLTVHAVSGYSGGGKSMIARWEGDEPALAALPFQTPYALETRHKHIPEMTRYSHLTAEPQFAPSVGPFANGMRIELPLHRGLINDGVDAASVVDALETRYADERFVHVTPLEESVAYTDPAFDPRACNDTNRLDISVLPNAIGHLTVIVQLDNLGKGASGAAVQNMNLMLGLPEGEGLAI